MTTGNYALINPKKGTKMKRIAILIALALTTMIGLTACSGLTTEEKSAIKTEVKSAFADTGLFAYKMYGRNYLASWLKEQGLTEEQQSAALAAADKGVDALSAYLKSIQTTTARTGTAASATAAVTATTAASAAPQSDQTK